MRVIHQTAAPAKIRLPTVPTEPMAEAGPEQPAGEGDRGGQERPGGDHEPGPQDRLVPDPGEEEDAAEDHGAEAGEEDQRADVGQGDGPVADDRRLDDRVGVTAGAHDQERAGHHGQPEGAQDGGAGPAPVRSLDNAGGQAGHGDGEQGGAGQVGLVRRGVLDLAQHPHPDHQGDQAEGQVDQEDPAPAGLDQDPADRRPEGGGGPADGRPQPDGGSLAGRAEGGEQEPERGRQHQRPAAGLEDAGGDQQIERGGDGTEGGGGGEDAQPDEEGPLAPGPVGPAPRRHQQRGEHDGVGAQHP